MSRRWDWTLAIALVACGGAPRPAPAADPSVTLDDVLPPPPAVHSDFAWRQRLSATYGDESFTLQAIVEKSGNTLSLLFLAPYGSRALLLQQVDRTVKTQYFVEQRLPFPARYILSDVHRVFLRGFGGAPHPDGQIERLVDGEWFVDTWRGGRLERREVFRTRSAPRAAVVIEYAGGHTVALPAARVVLDNRAHGYRIEIETAH